MTKEELKIEIGGIVSALRKEGKIHLAECLEENWNKTALSYSKELNSWQPSEPMEKELVWAFTKELERLGTTESLRIKILASLQKRRVLQTAPHLVATENPRMLCINWLGSLGVGKDDFYVVGMCSGIPFSNSFRPGRINRKDSSVNLFGSNFQDGLVYRSAIQNKLIEAIKTLPLSIRELLPEATLHESYTKWALGTCQNIERKIIGKKNLTFLDINEVVSNYLAQVLKNESHVFYKIFFDDKIRKEFTEIFQNETMFGCPVRNGKYEQMENMVLLKNNLQSKNKEISLFNPKILIAKLENGRLCPGLVLTFLAIAFLNKFKCFGSFYQVEYLPLYQEKFSKLKFMKEFGIESIPTANLTTGEFPGEMNRHPVDIIMDLENKKFKPKEEILFGELLLPIKDKLINERHQQK